MQRRSKTKVITFDDQTFERYVIGKSRPYSLFIIADAKKYRKTAKLDLEGRVEEFTKVAGSFVSTHAGKETEGRVFFVRITVEDAVGAFTKMGVKTLPFLGHIPPDLHVTPSGTISLKKQDLMPSSISNSAWRALEIGAFVQERTQLSPGDLSAAGAAGRSRLLPIFSLIVVIGVGYLGWKLYQAPFMQWTPLYAVGALFVFWFAVSGGMYNIIRGVPLVGYDRRSGQAMLFLQGQGQLGAEGFIMGTLYLTFGLMSTAFIRVLPTVEDESSRRIAGYGLIFALFLLFNIVTGNHLWKTGMRTYFYF